MTMPDERHRAVMLAREFLRDLLNPKKTPRIPRAVRLRAYSCLRHYPHDYEMDKVSEGYPHIFQNPDSFDLEKSCIPQRKKK